MMTDIEHHISLDVFRTNSQVTVNAKQGDNNRVLIIALTEGSTPYTFSEDDTYVFTALLPDGKLVYADKNTQWNEDGTVHIKVSGAVTGIPGLIPCELRIYDRSSHLLTSPRFTLDVEKAVYTDDELMAQENDKVSELTRLIATANGLVEDLDAGRITLSQYIVGDGERSANLNDYKTVGFYYFERNDDLVNAPNMANNGWLQVMEGTAGSVARAKQVWYRQGVNNTSDWDVWVRTYAVGEWSYWHRLSSPIHFDTFQYVYVDGVGGDDYNPGTNELPFKTMDRAFRMFNNGDVNLVITVKSAGDYTISHSYITSATLHIRRADGVDGNIVIRNPDGRDFVFYNCHINAGNVTFIPGSGVFYTENCVTGFNNTVIKGTYTVFGGTILAHDAAAENWGLDACTANLERCYVTRTVSPYAEARRNDKSLHGDGIYVHNAATCVIKGSIRFNPLTSGNADCAAIRVEDGSVCTILTQPDGAISYRYQYGILSNDSTVFAADSVKSSYGAVGSVAYQHNGVGFDADGNAKNKDIIFVDKSDPQDLNAYTATNMYFFDNEAGSDPLIHAPNNAINGWLDVISATRNGTQRVKQIFLRYGTSNINDGDTYVRTYSAATGIWSNWTRLSEGYNVSGVSSINGKTGSVTLTASDVGALPNTTPLFSGNYNDLKNKPSIPAAVTDAHINDLIDSKIGDIDAALQSMIDQYGGALA